MREIIVTGAPQARYSGLVSVYCCLQPSTQILGILLLRHGSVVNLQLVLTDPSELIAGQRFDEDAGDASGAAGPRYVR